MPTYDYQCEACEAEFQASHRMSDPPVDECPQCGEKGRVKRLMGTGAGLIFKGSGFYITDYKDSGKPPAKKDGDSSEKKDATKSSDAPKADSSSSSSSESSAKSSDAPKSSDSSKPSGGSKPAKSGD
jgi:putative FmdB family regulatory protein